MPHLAIVAECTLAFRTPTCYLCRRVYTEQFVAAVLTWDGLPLGKICPRCLNRRPALACPELLRRGSPGLLERSVRLRQRSAAIRHESEKLRTQSAEIRGQLRSAIEKSARECRHQASADAESADALLIAELAGLEVWPLSLDQLIALERGLFQRLFTYLNEGDLELLVDERYRVMLLS